MTACNIVITADHCLPLLILCLFLHVKYPFIVLFGYDTSSLPFRNGLSHPRNRKYSSTSNDIGVQRSTSTSVNSPASFKSKSSECVRLLRHLVATCDASQKKRASLSDNMWKCDLGARKNKVRENKNVSQLARVT